VIAARSHDARIEAQRRLTELISEHDRGTHGKRKDKVRGKIRAILDAWSGDARVIEAAKLAGWRNA